MISRRYVLYTGVASLLILGGGSAAVLTKSIEAAREPWAAAQAGFGDVRLNALAYAILAPNPHNRQPWQIRLGADALSFDLYCDLSRLLPETDPLNRQITIGLGAFLELFKMAAAEQGYRSHIDSFPQGQPYPILDLRPIASVRIAKDARLKRDPLFQYALARRTVRRDFDVSMAGLDDDMQALGMTAALSAADRFEFSLDHDKTARLKKLCLEGWHIESSTPGTHHETTALMRIGAEAVNANPDGISLHGPAMEGFKTLGLYSQEKAGTMGSKAHKSTVAFYDKLIETAGGFGWLTTPENSRREQLRAGADWVRLNLAATKLGIAMHPLSQVLQEFPEMAELYKALHDALGITEPARVQGLFRFGRAAYPKAAPRWPVESRLVQVA